MPNIDVLEKVLGIVSAPYITYNFSRKIFLLYSAKGRISFSDCLYFLRYQAMCVLQLFFSQVVTTWILKLNLPFSSRFSAWSESEYKNLYILRTKRLFKVKQKAIFLIIKGLSIAKNCLRPKSVSVKIWKILVRYLMYCQ